MICESVFVRNAIMWVEFILNEFKSRPAIWVLNVSVAELMFSITKV